MSHSGGPRFDAVKHQLDAQRWVPLQSPLKQDARGRRQDPPTGIARTSFSPSRPCAANDEIQGSEDYSGLHRPRRLTATKAGPRSTQPPLRYERPDLLEAA